jgi:hypothetical protein
VDGVDGNDSLCLPHASIFDSHAASNGHSELSCADQSREQHMELLQQDADALAPPSLIPSIVVGRDSISIHHRDDPVWRRAAFTDFQHRSAAPHQCFSGGDLVSDMVPTLLVCVLLPEASAFCHCWFPAPTSGDLFLPHRPRFVRDEIQGCRSSGWKTGRR